jgi:hypothetical protein
VFAALALDEWDDRPVAGDRPTPDRNAVRGGLILVAVTLLAIGSLWLAAAEFGWPRDRALWVGVGLFLAVMALTRPWWFWENRKACWLRRVVGDEPTAGIYLALAAAMVWLGLFAEWTFGAP